MIVRSTLAATLVLTVCWASAQTQQKATPPASDTPQATETQQPAAKSDGASAEQKTPEQKSTEPSKPMTPAEARQAQLLADTQRLYQLTQELKAEVAKSNKDTLSLSVIKKADEVEKLARSVKERMRQQQ